MKKVWNWLVLLPILSLVLSGCSQKWYEYEDLSEYIQIGVYRNVPAEFSDPGVCTEKEMEDAIFQVMLSYADFTKEKEGAAEWYNLVLVNYDVYHQGSLVEDEAAENHEIILGMKTNSDMETLLSQALIGKNKGDTVKIDYTYPDDFALAGGWAGLTVQVEAQVQAIYLHQVSECTDEFVRLLEGFSFQTVEDLKASLREDIREEKEQLKREAVLDAFLAEVEILKYPEEEFQRYYDEYCEDYEKSAKDLDVPLEEYLSEYLMIDRATLEGYAKEHAEERVKSDLITVQLSRLRNVSLTREEYEKGVEKYFNLESGSFENVDEYEKHYSKHALETVILWDKVFQQLVDEAVMK